MIAIDYRSRLPIYEQLVENIRMLVLSGALEGDEQLPSVRQLSGDLGINPNTVQKAYAYLEQAGVIYTVPGRGAFVRSDTSSLRSGRSGEILEQLGSLAAELMKLGIPEEDAVQRIREAYKEGKK